MKYPSYNILLKINNLNFLLLRKSLLIMLCIYFVPQDFIYDNDLVFIMAAVRQCWYFYATNLHKVHPKHLDYVCIDLL